MDLIATSKSVTRFIFSCSTFLALATTANILKEQDLTFVPSRISDGELWRAVTGLLYLGKMDVEYFSLLLMHATSLHWHESSFYHRTRTFIWRLVLISVMSLLFSSYLRLRFPGIVVLVALTYLSSRRNENERLGFFGLTLPSGLFPFHTIALSYAFGNMSTMKTYIAGGLIGHFVLLIDDIYPAFTRQLLPASGNELD